MPFNNSIVGGVGTLIRQWLRSPNYVAGVSGWTINRDGSAEFNNVTIRGNLETEGFVLFYDGTPAVGNLLMALSAAAGTDAFGNNYAKGLSLMGDNISGFLQYMRNDGTIQGTIYDNGPGNGIVVSTPSGQALFIRSGTQFLLVDDAIGYQFNNGPGGKYYAADMSWSQALTSGTFTQINGFTILQRNTDYGGQFAAGVFTSPVDSFYDGSLYMDTPGAGATQMLTAIRRNGSNVAMNNTPNTGRGANCAFSSLWLAQGDTVTFHVQQTGVAGNPVCTGLAQIARRL